MLISRALLVLASASSVAVAIPVIAQERTNGQERGTRAADPATIEGSFIATAGERDGKPLTQEQIKGVTFRFDADKLVITDQKGTEIHKCTHTIDKSSNPWRINMKMSESAAGDKTAIGLIQREGDTVTFIYPLAGGETPTEFRTKEKQEMYQLKLQK